jgi:hypothetical protein
MMQNVTRAVIAYDEAQRDRDDAPRRSSETDGKTY